MRIPTEGSAHWRGRAGMIAEILPAIVMSAEAFNDPVHSPLFPEEEVLVAAWAEQRRREFATVRVLARRAIAELGLPPVPITRNGHGAPAWPPGVVGSLTHCHGYRAAVVARADQICTIGIDAEPALPLPDGALRLISLPEERRQLKALATADPAVCWDRLLFCIKEAIFKAWFPLTERWLGFRDALVNTDPSGTFTATLLVPGPRSHESAIDDLSGRWLQRRGLLVAAIADCR
jgi:4'-phosphopantetheinyl transferase EntD